MPNKRSFRPAGLAAHERPTAGSTSETVTEHQVLGERVLLFVLVGLFSLGTIETAWAIPGPMPEAQLLASSDLVALVRVLSVTCVAIFHERHHELRRYTAELGILRLRKGNHRRYDIVEATWAEHDPDVLGPWRVPFYPGAKGWVFLKRIGDAYTATWINAADLMGPRSGKRPRRLMQTMRNWSAP